MPAEQPRRILDGEGPAAVAAVRARAGRSRDLDRRRIERVLAREGITTDPARLCAAVLERARVTLNFHPDRLAAGGRSVAEALRDEGIYRNQWETGISNGGLTARPGGDRDEWERRLFDGVYHLRPDPPATSIRPKYGGLNLAGFTNGPAPAFGSCALVLGRGASARTTFLFGDSSVRTEDMGTADAFEPVLAALLERLAESGQMLGLPGVRVAELVDRLEADPPRPPVFSRVLDDYIETHTHGPLRLASDAEALLLDPSYRGTPTGEALLEAGERHRLRVHWHAGSELSLAAFPTTTSVRGGVDPPRWQRFLLSGRAARLAERVIRELAPDGMRLTAAAIGRAAGEFIRAPGEWSDWGAPDPSLTVLKDLWRILAAHGTPLTTQLPPDPPAARARSSSSIGRKGATP